MTQKPGQLFVVVGPSGVGKDSLMDFARERLKDNPRVHFVRRAITRSAESGGEYHDPVPAERFAEMQQNGAFVVSWEAHGLQYGIPGEAKDIVAAGDIAVVNGSRHALPSFTAAFPELTIVSITAKPEILAERLRKRGRESEDDICKRLNRIDPDFSAFAQAVIIDNSGNLETGGNQLVLLLEDAIGTDAHNDANSETVFSRFINNAALFL